MAPDGTNFIADTKKTDTWSPAWSNFDPTKPLLPASPVSADAAKQTVTPDQTSGGETSSHNLEADVMSDKVTTVTFHQLEDVDPETRERIWDHLNKPVKTPDPTAGNPDESEENPDKEDDKLKLLLAELLGGAAALEAAKKDPNGWRNHHLMRKFKEERALARAAEAASAEKEEALLKEAKIARGSGKIEEAAVLEQEARKLGKLSKLSHMGPALKSLSKFAAGSAVTGAATFAIIRAVEAGLIYKLAPDDKKEKWAWEVGTRSPLTAEARKDWADGKYLAAAGDEFKGVIDDLSGLAKTIKRIADDPQAAWGQAKKDLADISDGLEALHELYQRDPRMADKIAMNVAADAGVFGDEFTKDPDKIAQLAHAGFMGDAAGAKAAGKDVAFDAVDTSDKMNVAVEQVGAIQSFVSEVRSKAGSQRGPHRPGTDIADNSEPGLTEG